MFGWPAKEYANDIRLLSPLTVLEGDILLDRKDARYAPYLSSGMDYGAHAAAVGSGQILGTQKTEEEWEEKRLLSICLTFERHKSLPFDVTETMTKKL